MKTRRVCSKTYRTQQKQIRGEFIVIQSYLKKQERAQINSLSFTAFIDKVQHLFKKKLSKSGYRENIPKHKGHIIETHSHTILNGEMLQAYLLRLGTRQRCPF